MNIGILWNVTPCSAVEVYRCFGRTDYFHRQARSLIYPNRGSRFLRNMSTHLPDYTVSHIRRQPFSPPHMILISCTLKTVQGVTQCYYFTNFITLPQMNTNMRSQDRVAGTVASYGLDGPGVRIPARARDFLFYKPSRSALQPNKPPVQQVPWFFPGGNKAEAKIWPPTSIRYWGYEWVELYIYSPICLYGVDRDNFMNQCMALSIFLHYAMYSDVKMYCVWKGENSCP